MTVLAFARGFLGRHGQLVLNLLVFFGIAHWVLEYTLPAFLAGRFDFIDTLFLFHNGVMLALILLRREPQAVDHNFFHQAVAVVAFFSGLGFVGEATARPALLLAAHVVIIAALVLGTATLFNLGRSFGILIAYRKLESSFLYGVVRHPMYLTDILWKIGIVLEKPNGINFAIFLLASACYVYRALLEEKFLARQPEYRDYMTRVRYRFIPGVF